MELTIRFHLGLVDRLMAAERDGAWDRWSDFELAFEARRLGRMDPPEVLMAPRALPNMTFYPHQIATAETVIRKMRGRAILADEVGLGKTIEAGLILKEYMIRGLVKKALLLVPASLALQWQRELWQKFLIPAAIVKKAPMWEAHDVVIASLDLAKREPHRSILLRQAFDFLLVDEAHKLKNPRTANHRFVRELTKKFCLLLTATPVQNDIRELYTLVSLLLPGHLGTEDEFRRHFVAGRREVKNAPALRGVLREVMIRNRRKDADIALPDRHVVTVPVRLTKEERRFYDAVSQFIVREYARRGMPPQFALLTLKRELVSSRDAVYKSLIRLYERLPKDAPLAAELAELARLGREIRTHSKAKTLVELLGNLDGKAVVFTEFHGTLFFLQKTLAEAGIPAVLYRGGYGQNKKDWMRELFEKKARVLLATDAGGEGLNLQFAHHLINYDLPWNPLKLEQRIGRIHRIGQTRDVFIYHFITEGTIEEAILKLLYEKLALFEKAVGTLENVLERLPKGFSVERHIAEIFLRARSEKDALLRLENVVAALKKLEAEEARRAALAEAALPEEAIDANAAPPDRASFAE
ncbi:DEAD/DEAH box helicase [Hydrogenibacillus schlegelii]|uniref:DEAD/DEAH box helicase n=1 Tax=Hydrogenibacillus schlegelii TaxID=1484 RepID=UPI00200E65D7|nr:SNF2-related protein [Hydrogenibacillus schlegelii]